MELESKTTDLAQTSLHEDSDAHQPNPDPQFEPPAEDFNHPQDNSSPLDPTNQPIGSMTASTNFDEMPISSKSNLTFEQMIEANLKASGLEAPEPSTKQNPVSRPPKPKTSFPKFVRGATGSRPQSQSNMEPGSMEEESGLVGTNQIEQSSNQQISPSEDKFAEQTFAAGPEDIIVARKNSSTGMNIEEEKIKKTSQPGSAEPIKRRRSSDMMIPENKKEERINEEHGMQLTAQGDQNFDEVPVGKTGGFSLSAYPEGQDGMEESNVQSQDTGPLQNRIKSKVWKVRQTAFEELAEKFREADKDDDIFDEYRGELPKLLGDANPGAQEKAIDAFKVYLEKRNGAGIDGKSVIKNLIDKALAPGKPNIKKITLEVICLMFEHMEKKEIIEGVVDSINHKNQKVSCAGVQALVELLTNYGPRKLEFLKPFFPAVEKLAASTVSSQRTEAMNFYKEAYKYMGEALKPFIVNLKKAQIDELEKFFSECPSELAKPAKADASEVEMGGGASGGQERRGSGALDVYEIADAVDLFKKFNDGWSEKVLAKEKWNEKKTMLEELLKEASQTPKIAANAPFPHMTNMLKKVLVDSNQQVMLTGIKIYGALAKGLRRNLSNACKNIMPTILAKLKDKKNVVEETMRTMDNFLYSIGPEDVLDDLQVVFNDKAPVAKVQVLKWIEKHFEKNSKTPEKLVSLYRSLLPTFKKLIEDGSAEVREQIVMTLARIKFILGDGTIKESLNDINSTKLARINELAQSLADGRPIDMGSSMIGGGGAMPAPRRKPNLSLSENIEEEKSGTAKRSTSRTGEHEAAKIGGNRPQTSKANAASGKQIPQQGGLKKVGSMKTLGSAQDNSREREDSVSQISAEDAEMKMQELNVPEGIVKAIDNPAWKERQKALEEFSMFIRENAETVGPSIEYVFKYIRVKLKDWKESNLSVVKEAFNTICAITETPEIPLTKRCFSVISPFIINNLHDPKYTESCNKIVTSFVETISPKFVIMQLVEHFLETKDSKTAKVNPKALTEVSNLLVKLLDVLTLNYFPLKDTIEFSKIVLANQNIQARNAAISLLKSIYQQLGPPLNDFLNDVNPQTLKTLNAEFEKIVPNKDVQCKVQFRGEAQSELSNQGSSSAASNLLDSLPRVDISKDVEKLLKKLGDSKWEVRREALEALGGLLTASHNRIAATGLQELVTALKSRLNDNNKSLVKSCIMFVGNFATAVGPNVRIYAKPLIQELVKNLLDKQAVIRTETVVSLDKFAAEVGSEMVINIAFPLLNQENPELRQTFIPWILKNQDSLTKVDLRAHIGVVLSILQDKTKEIRNLGEKLLEKCIGVIGTGPYITALKDLKPAIQKALTPIVTKYSNTGGTGAVMTEPDLDSDGGNNSSLELKIPQNRSLNKIPSESNLRGGVGAGNKPQRPGTSASVSMIQESSGSKKGGRPTTPTGGSMTNIQIPTSGLGNSGPNSSRNSGGMINLLGQKGKRQDDEKRNKWNTDDLKDDMVEKLKENVKKNVSQELYQKMFSFDARKQIEAIQCLKKALVQEFQGTVDILDLIIRWLFFKLWDNSNMQIAKEALDYVYNLVLTLEAAKTSLEDFELNVLVPFLLQRLVQGHSNTKVTLYKIFQKLGEVAYVQKITSILVQNSQSKNARIRDESLEVITVVVKEYKGESLAAKEIRALGKMLGHTDAIVRNHCLNIFTELGVYMKDDLLRTLKGEAPQKALDTLIQRIKSAEGGNRFERRAGGGGNSGDFSVSMYEESNIFSGSHKGPSIVSSSFIHDKENAYDMENLENRDYNKYGGGVLQNKIGGMSTVESKESMTRDTSLLGTPQTKVKGFPVVGGQKIEEELFDRNLNLLVSGSMSNRLDALLLIHDIVIADNEETREFLRIKADDLIKALYVTLKNVFEKSKNEVPLKFAFYFLNMTHKLCSIRAFLKNVTEENLKKFSEELLQRLLAEDDEKRFDAADNENLVKTLNAIMLRVLENAEADDMFNVLFDLLIKNRRVHSYAKILGLIVKCILKLTKALNQLVPTLHPETLLIKFHLYILEFGAAQTEDIGIKTIKTLLNELVKVYHESIWDSYTRSVQIHSKPDQVLHSWITVILRHLNGEKSDQPQFQDFNTTERVTPDRRESGDNFRSLKRESGNFPNPPVSESVYYQTQQQQQPNENYEIKQLIENLRLSTDLESGIKQLHTALKKYPGLSLTPYLQHSTSAFSEYIYKALERLDNREKSQSQSDTFSSFKFTTTQQQQQQPSDLNPRLKLDDTEKPQVERLNQEVISPRATMGPGVGGGSTTLSLEDFQNKVNTLKLRYGLILKKGNEPTELSSTSNSNPKPNQTTMVYRTTANSQLPERTERRDPSREREAEKILPAKIETFEAVKQKEPSPYDSKTRESLARFGGYSPAVNEGTSASLNVSTVTAGSNMMMSSIGSYERPALSEQNTRTEPVRSNSGISEGNSGASSVTGTGGARSTESILQRLSEMKMKMASIVNSNKNGGNN